MTTIITRQTGVDAKGSPLTNEEVDTNFINLKGGKAELSGDTFTGDVTIEGTVAPDDVQMKTGLAANPSYAEGLFFYDPVHKTISLYTDIPGVLLQIGAEFFMRVNNNTAGTLLNGKAVQVESVGVLPQINYANAAEQATSINTIGLLTHDIAPGADGWVTLLGFVRDIDTSTLSEGPRHYLSDSEDGALTTTPPSSPSYIIEMGGVLNSHPTEGILFVNPQPRGNTSDVIKIFNGAILEDHNVAVTSDGATVTLTLTDDGAAFLSLFQQGNFTKFSVPATVTLTPGTDESPVLNYVYIPEGTSTLTADVVLDFPTVEQITPVATVLVQSPSSVLANGCYKVHAWTDHLADAVGQGHLSHINRWIRKQHATWIDGTLMSFTGSGTGTVQAAITSGHVLQLHQQNFPAIVEPAPFYVINDFTAPYARVTNIAALLNDSTGTILNNKSFGLVFWGVVNQDTGDCKIMMNRPSGGYSASKPAEAAADILNYNNYSIPEEYKGVGFLLRRLICSLNPAGTALTLYEGTYEGDDLRGQSPGITAGGGGFAGSGNVPPGGDIGQHLTKVSAIDNDTAWTPPFNATTAELENIVDPVNVNGKYIGTVIFNTSTTKPVWSVGILDSSNWVDATGSIVHTPS